MAGPPLEQGVGWGIVLGFGAFFAIVMSLLTLAQKRYLQEHQTSEMFMTAHRSVKTGLVASAVVSSWTWAATLLQSSSVAYKYGTFLYASGATIQVLLFAILAVEVKRKAPNAHTFLEIVNARYGKVTHIIFLIFGMLTNGNYCNCYVVTRGSAVVNALTGVNTIACCFLLPLGVLIYTLFGGLKATFLTDYVHTSVIYIIILSFLFTVYASSDVIGSPGKMNNFCIINIVGNFGTVFVDNAYWQRAIAARPSSTVKAYLIGGLSWFSIPFTLLQLWVLLVSLLLCCRCFAVMVLVFMAVTSAASAELIAVSSIYTYDIYRTYIHSGALGKQVIRQSHASVIFFGLLMGALATILNYIGVDLGYMYLLMGIISSPAVIPVAYTLVWKKQTAVAAVAGALLGLICGIIAWLVAAQKLFGEITLKSTGDNYPMLAGNLSSLIISGLVATIVSLIKPANFDFDITRQKLEILTDDEVVENAIHEDPMEKDPVRLTKAFNFAIVSSVALTIILIIIWPLPMYGTRYVFSRPFFTFWVAISMIWAIIATIACTIYPVVESRRSITTVIVGMIRDIRGQRITHEKKTDGIDKSPSEIIEDKA
ncbi:unnamed protein product [Rhizophagus irregularis]|nr:unnamed protein product [Rhizophagus irregularis]